VDATQAIHLAVQLFQTATLLAAPALVVALAVGFLVGVFQAMTMINEPTLSFVPKLLALMIVFVVLGPWMLATVVGYTRELWQTLPQMP
jgi:flagellar biosynthetic protein FliQ